MPSTYDRLILGAGTTAATYLGFFPPQSGEKVGVIGMPDPWSRRGDHRMGQPPHLLMLPLAHPQRAPEFPPHSTQTATVADDAADPPSDPFLRSDDFARQQIALPDVKYRRAWVASVTRIPEGLKVSYEYESGAKKYLYARKVVVATGPGAPREASIYDETAPPGVFHTGDAYLDANVADDIRGKSVMVQGGSATAAWSVEKALRSGAGHVYWIHRPQGQDDIESRFGDAFPAGKRNDWLKEFERRTERVTRHLAEPVSTQWSKGELVVAFKGNAIPPIRVHQFVAALGAGATADYLGSIRDELVPIVDTDGHLHTDADCVLAYTDARQQVLVIGAGIFRLPGKDSSLYVKGNEYLPRAGRPPEGIPTIIATLATLSRYLQKSKSAWLDINLANFADLDNHFRQGVARTFATVLTHRTGRPLALTSRFVTDQVVGTRIMKTSPYGITVEEIAALYDNIATRDEGELRVMLNAFE